MANFFDLNPTQTKSTDGKYIDLVFTGFVPDTDYGLTFAWVYEDPKLGVSGESNIFAFKTIAEPELAAPQFRDQDVDAINSILYINWTGKDATGQDYLPGKLKQVNIWIKGGDFGEEFKQYAASFTKAGTIQINATQKATYCVKLQAEGTTPGLLSPFSETFCVTLLKQPKAVYDIRHEWDNAGNLSLFWKFDPTFKDATNDNTLADSFGLQLLDETNDMDATWWTSVEKDKIPPLEQKIVISSNQLQKVFGEFTAFEIDYTGAIYVRDKNLQTSFVTGYSVTKYSDPLTAPVISATKAPMAYNVSYTANSTFDKIYIEESTNSGTTWTNVGVTSSNPAYVPTINSTQRSVRAKFSKKLGGFTGYSNTVTVTPDKIDPTDTTAPANPTNVSATAVVDSNDKTGFSLQATISFTKSSDSDCRGYRIRWTTQTTNPIYEYGYVDHPSSGTTVSFTVSGLIPDITYYYQVAAVDQFNNTQSYTNSGTFIAQDSVATAEGSLARLKSYISIGGATGDQFKFGTGISESINTSTTTTPALSSGTYHGILLNKTGNKNNFWLTTGQLRVGTDTQFMYFNGTDLYLTGDINARSGSITGNLTMTGGGSVIARTTAGSNNKVTLSYAGLFAYDANGTETTQIISNAAAGAATFTTTKALIGNWSVGTNTISAGGVTLNSSTPSIIATNGGSYVGIKPRASAGTDIVLWTGNTDSPAINSAASGQAGFQVNANGQLYATGAIISGKITVESGSSLGGLLNDTSKVYYSSSTPTAPSGGHKIGDAWIDTSSNNVLKIWDGTTWQIAQDSESAKTIANLKNRTFTGTELASPIRPNVTGVTFVAGDLWVNTSSGNKLYRYDGSAWTSAQDQGAADGSTALSRVTGLTDKFGTGVNAALLKSLVVNTNGAHIYSSYVTGGTTVAKDSYTSTNTGFFIGWDVQAGVIYPAINIGNANAYVKWTSYGTGTLEVKGNIVNGGDYWNTDGSFKFGGSSGITKGATGQVTIGSNVLIQGSVTASSLDTTYTDIDTSGNITIINGTKTTTLSNNATLTMTDTSNGWDSGGAISINSQSSGYYGTESTTLSVGGNRIQLSRSGGTPSASYQSWIAHADELAGVSRGTLLITTGTSSGITLKPNGGTASSTYPVYIFGRLDTSFGGIVPGAYIAGNTTYTSRAIRNITVNTTSPSGGNEGDIWIQI